MGHRSKQIPFEPRPWRFRYSHGGELRKKRAGRRFRPLSTKTSIHLVFKADRTNQKRGLRSPLGFIIATNILKKYARRFHVKIEQAAVCPDHIHLMIRLSRRSLGQHFFRVVAGQIAQQFMIAGMLVTDTRKLWKMRPFTRVAWGHRALKTLRAYVRLNHLESIGKIAYRPQRLRGMLPEEYAKLWDTT